MPFGEAFAAGLKIVIAALIGFAGGFWILSALFDRRISAREAVALAAGLFFVIFFSVSLMLRGGPGLLFLAAVVFGSALFVRELGRLADRKMAAGLDRAEIAECREAVRLHPDNPHAHSLLADVYRRVGNHQLAAEEYEAALELDASLKQERYWLRRMRTEIERAMSKDMACPRCGTTRRGREAECAECGRLYSSLETWRHEFRVMDAGRRALWLGSALGAAAVVVGVLSWAPGAAKLMSAGVLIALPLFVMLVSTRMRRRTG
jgi:tetratricopeptide (TPR) repeat protein